MATLLLRLVGPMQSWGTTSRFDHRDSGKEPSKSGVVGLLAAALGIRRENWLDLEPLARLTMGVRHDRAGELKRDYQTAKDIISADGRKIHETAVTKREYLADAAFLVGLGSDDRALLERAHTALRDPVWPLALGRKSYVPSETTWLDDGVQSTRLRDTLAKQPWIVSLQRWERPPDQLLISLDSEDGSGVLRMDQPLSSFAERRFGARYVRSEWIPLRGWRTMLLHRLHLNPRCREARRDLADPYQMHATLCRAFSPPDEKCPEGMFLWRLEPESGPHERPRLLVQSRSPADWSRLHLADWLASVDPAIDLADRLRLDSLQAGQRFRFRLRANPTVTRNRKRLGLMRLPEQEAWVARKGALHGFELSHSAPAGRTGRLEVQVSQEQMLRGRQHAGNGIRVFAVLFDGVLRVTEPGTFRAALRTGIGHGKALGLGLLSVVPTA